MSLNHLPASSYRTEGCTLTGALSVTTQIRDAITVVHGPSGCTHHNFSLLHATSLDHDRVAIPPIISSGLSETEVVFGGEGALDRTLDRAISREPAAIFVLSTCIAETIGDDVAAVCNAKAGVPVIVIPTAGFLGGSFQTGVNNALVALAGMAEPSPGRKGQVNIIGEKNLEYEVDENFAEVTRLLSLLDLSVSTRFVHNLTAEEIRSVGAARLNVLRDPSLIPVGEYCKERFDIPYISGFPVGLSGTITFLESVGAACAIDPRPAIEAEHSFEQETLGDFADIAGHEISFSSLFPVQDGERAVRDIARAFRLDVIPSGTPVPVPVTPPVGITGVRRMLHRWRRAIHA